MLASNVRVKSIWTYSAPLPDLQTFLRHWSRRYRTCFSRSQCTKTKAMYLQVSFYEIYFFKYVSTYLNQKLTIVFFIFYFFFKITKCVNWRLWQYRLWSFQAGGTKVEMFLHKNQHTQRKLLNFEFWINGELSQIGHHFTSKKK